MQVRKVTADTYTWLAARQFLLQRAADLCLQLTLARKSFAPEAIHDLRVACRRLREGFAIFSACFSKSRLAPIRKELKRLTRMLGAIRNSDEALLFFSPLGGEADAGARAESLPIVARLQAERAAEKRTLKRELKKIDPRALLERVDAACSKPLIFKPAGTALFRPVASWILTAIAAREKAIGELLPDALAEKNSSAQHRLRIAVKHFRYRLEFLAPFAGGDYKTVYSNIKEYQEILGRLHDLDVFSNLLAGAGDGPGKSTLKNIISVRRRVAFNEFRKLHKKVPLHKAGDLVRGLL